jgi:hypothetical protein
MRTAVARPVSSTAAANATVAATSTRRSRAAMPWSMPICTRNGPACSSSVSTSTASAAASSSPGRPVSSRVNVIRPPVSSTGS